MNIILLSEGDFIDAGRARLSARRFLHLSQVLHAQVGDSFKVGLIDGKLGTGEVESLDEAAQEIILRVSFTRDPLPTPKLTLLMAMPRPLAFKRVIGHAVTLGVREIIITGSARVEKSYFQTPLLTRESLSAIILEALEISGDTRLPAISIFQDFEDCIEQPSSLILNSRKLLAHPGSQNTLIDIPPPSKEDDIVLAIGPEGGFIPEEVEILTDLHFEPITLGDRILRVETAVSAAIAQVNLWRLL